MCSLYPFLTKLRCRRRALVTLRRAHQRHPRHRLDGVRQGGEGAPLQARRRLQAHRPVRLDPRHLQPRHCKFQGHFY